MLTYRSPLVSILHNFFSNSVAEMVEWILLDKHHLSDLLHYLDDFITTGPWESSEYAYNLNTAVSVCHRLGLPLYPNKCVGRVHLQKLRPWQRPNSVNF